ncbi:MAG: diaminopimelate decarboxylase [Calditrichia bacterium]
MNHEHINRDLYQDLASRYGTPLYVYDKQKIQENIYKLKSAISTYFDDFRIQYPIKANSNPHILTIIAEEGLFADCSSPAEVFIAQKCGFDMGLSTYTGNYETVEDYYSAVSAGMIINMDDIRIKDLLSVGKPDIISFRINPGIGRGGFEGIVTGGTDAKFGIPYEKTTEAYQAALEAGFTRFGIHMMTGSNILEPFYFAEITQKLLMIAGETFGRLNIKPEFINIGGGLGIPYTDEELELDLDATFRHIRDVFMHETKNYNLGHPTLVVEPGRFLVGNAGMLVSKVTHIKHSYRQYIGIDAGMNVLIRPALYKAYHRIEFLSEAEEKKQPEHFYVTGQICENSDIHPVERSATGITPGDLCIIHDAGAYGYVMASHYNHRPRPAEVLLSENGPVLIRKADQIQDMFRNIPNFEL